MITRVLPLFALASCLLIQRTTGVCPNEEFIQPCSCMTVAFGNHVVCGSINSSLVLKDIFRVLSNYEIHTLLINTLHLPDTDPLSPGFFTGIKVTNLRFEDSVFTISNANVFTGLEDYLNILDISNCNIKRLNEATFKHLVRMRKITMNFDSMVSVTNNWFKEGPANVKIVNLDHNDIETIVPGAFHGLENIETISLADNRLHHINRDMLPNQDLKLEWIDLSYNKLTDLPPGFFDKMSHLKRVVLTGNLLKSLPKSTWEVVWGQLEHLILKDNPIVCDNEIRWLFRRERPSFNLNGSCKEPKELTGTRLSRLTEDQLQSR